ncbi:unnamed protein product [Schistosoma margrebowiei]|uniref:Uncharacterized protein n=1 Tax=Schistosoma margrebowiei TaxID=48269 RepID=A0A183M4J0_9TREM|nr:unnamed protein product [Schistosoma margrebowiei]
MYKAGRIIQMANEKTSTFEGKHGKQWTACMQLHDQDFADDLALLFPTQQQMQMKTPNVAAAAAVVDLNIYKETNKILEYSSVRAIKIKLGAMEEVEALTHLDGIIEK